MTQRLAAPDRDLGACVGSSSFEAKKSTHLDKEPLTARRGRNKRRFAVPCCCSARTTGVADAEPLTGVFRDAAAGNVAAGGGDLNRRRCGPIPAFGEPPRWGRDGNSAVSKTAVGFLKFGL